MTSERPIRPKRTHLNNDIVGSAALTELGKKALHGF